MYKKIQRQRFIGKFSSLRPGMAGGKFLERQRVKKPNQPRYGTELSEYYLARDMFVGNTVELNRFRFQLIDADEYAFRYMEQHASEVNVLFCVRFCVYI